MDITPVPYLWAEVSLSDLRRLWTAPPFRMAAPVESTDPAYAVVERLQAWSNRIHDAVAKRYWKGPGPFPVPRPQLLLFPAKSANAWVASLPVCLEVSLDIASLGTPGRPKQSKEVLALLPDAIRERPLGQIGGAPLRCATTSWSNDVSGFVDHFNSIGGECQLEITPDGLAVDGDGCRYSGSITDASRVAIYATGAYFNITSEMLLAQESEESMLVVVAHELGHYYQSHGVTAFWPDKYEYWFEQSTPPIPGKPSPVDDSDDIKARMKRLFPYPIPTIPTQHFSPRMSRFLARGVTNLLTEVCTSNCACSDALALTAGDWPYEFGVGVSFISETAEQQFLQYESALLACASEISITNGGGGIERDALFEQAQFGNVDQFVGSEVLAASDLAEFLAAMNTEATKLDAEKNDLILEIDERHLGRFTPEQEADEFAVEMVSAVGMAPATAPAGALAFARFLWNEDQHSFLRKNLIDFPLLEEFYNDHFLAKDGSPIFIPLGANLHDPHHSRAYRVFHMSREVTAHGYTAIGDPLPEWDVSWTQVQEWAVELGERVPSGPRPFAMNPGNADPDDASPLIID